ncbi:hypothetical protein Daus18300_005039 [Diaporthe australafricana]|uniref:Heterokaryon incompatibility domain-containing protein n=1 Tax=Diaporthe australafricana TaxID=127596 RepID=A0ABR3X4P4_9PEZI
MASWHESDCRRPDVVLLDNVPTCMSCGSLFFEDDDDTQQEMGKQKAAANKTSSRLNLDWPSSITFSSPDDVTDPILRNILLSLDRQTEHPDEASQDGGFIQGESTSNTEVEPSVVVEDSQCTAEPSTSNALEQDGVTQKYIKKPDLDTTSGVEIMSAERNAIYPLLGGTDEIRLLELDACDSATQVLHGVLRPTRLSQRPDYIALSYTWADNNGDSTLGENIFLGNAWTPFAITINCAAALRRLRLRGGTRVLWIDAICIDQANIGERSHQVSLMKDIYSRAESVAIFLGGHTGQGVNSPGAKLMQRLTDDRFRAGRAVRKNWGGAFDYHGVSDLFRLPYWSRIWVIQEVLLARRADIMLGNTSISLHEFIENFMKHLPEPIKDLLPLWLYSQGGSRFGDVDAFSDLLKRTSTCKASDERDMVFALFGLVQGASLEGLEADYSKTMTEIHTGLAAYFLIRHGQSGLLKAAASAATTAAKAANYRIQSSMPTPAAQAITYHRLMTTAPSHQALGMTSFQIRNRDAKARPWDPQLASWIPFGKSLPQHETELFEEMSPLTFDAWCESLAATGRRPGPTDYHHLTILHPTSCEATLPGSQSIYKVFGNHGALLVQASPVVHISYMGSALLHGAFSSTTTNIFHGDVCVLAAADAPLKWEICVHSNAPFARDDDWIVEVPGCDTFLHLRPSERASGAYEIASLSSVLLAIDYDQPENSAVNWQDGQGPLSKGLMDPATDYRHWMPLLSCWLHHLLFLRRWDAITQMERTVAPREPSGRESTNYFSSEVLEVYARWLEIKPTPDESSHNVQLGHFDSAVRTVSIYLERWQDLGLWSKICGIVIEVPWRENLEALAEIKADAWHYLTTSDRSNTSRDEARDSSLWEPKLRELFDDLVDRLKDIPLQATEDSLGRLMSMDTCSSLQRSISNIPNSWDVEDIRNNEMVIFKEWMEVKSCWEFMQHSKADCHALRTKFVQLHALKRLYRREHRDFLIC